MSLSWRVVMTIEVTALVCGTVYSLTRKFMNLTEAEGLPDMRTHFRHPLFQGFWCFLGQLLAWPIWWRLQQREARRRAAEAPSEDLVTLTTGEPLLTTRRVAFLCAVPTVFDVLGTVLNNTGLILTHVSVYQMLRGSVVLFTSLCAKVFLRTEFSTAQVHGLSLITAGVFCIGSANTLFMDRQESVYAPWPALGNVLIILSQALMAGLFVAEETLLKSEKVPPMQMLGWEATIGVGLSGVLMLFALALPGRDAGRLENAVHAYLQMVHSPQVFVSILTMALALLCFNITGVYITKLQSATHRACVDATRQALVWVHALYVGWETQHVETAAQPSAPVPEEFLLFELIGYVLLVLGTLSFNEIIALPLPERFPWCWRAQKRSLYSTIG